MLQNITLQIDARLQQKKAANSCECELMVTSNVQQQRVLCKGQPGIPSNMFRTACEGMHTPPPAMVACNTKTLG